MGEHLTHNFSNIGDVIHLLEESVVYQYKPLIYSQYSFHEQPLVYKLVDPIQYLVDLALPLESDSDTTHIFFSSSFLLLKGTLFLV